MLTMIIKSYKEAYDKVSEKLGINRKIVEMVASAMWNDLNFNIANFKKRQMYVPKLGVFTFRKIKAEKYLNEETYLRNLDSLKIKDKEKCLIHYRERSTDMKRLVDEWELILEEKRQFKNKVNESTKGDIQKQVEDMGRVKE